MTNTKIEVIGEGKAPLVHRMAVRLTLEQRKKIKVLAAKIGVSDSTLGRMWIVEKLNEVEAP